MSQRSARGAWRGPASSGGCPKFETWPNNPQFLLKSSAATEVTITLAYSGAEKLPIGFVVMLGEGSSRKTKLRGKDDIQQKTNWKRVTSVSSTVALQPNQPYIVLPCTFDPGLEGEFELTAAADAALELTPLPDAPPVAPVSSSAANARPAAPVSGGAAAPTIRAAAAAAADSEVKVVSEGQGLSEKQTRDLRAAVDAAVAQCSASGRKYEDPDFPPTKASLWIDGQNPGAALGVGADVVASWRRPEEFSSEPRLFINDWEVAGIVPGPLPDQWFLSAANILAGDVSVIQRAFVDASHGANGFYAVRFFVEDPSSDDDWAVVLVDDRLPCGADGKPCFARSPVEGVLWASILEKAFAKFRGSYEAIHAGGGASAEEGLTFLTGGLAKEVDLTTADGAAALAGGGGALWQQLMEAWGSGHVIGCRHKSESAAPPELQEKGLVANATYCVVVGGETSQGKLVRVRGLVGWPEWNGAWNDEDPRWTNQMRQMMQYKKDSNDGMAWMGFDDFCAHFNALYFCRMADDRWTRMTAKGKWEGQTAGGCADFVSWRHNAQWLLSIAKPTRLTFSLSLALPPHASAASAAEKPADKAIGLYLLRGNNGADALRRKLALRLAPPVGTPADDLALAPPPRFTRRLTFETTLEPSAEPYVVMPYTHQRGQEGEFTLVVRSDDTNDDGQPDFKMAPVRAADDWVCRGADGAWTAAGGPPGTAAFEGNPKIHIKPACGHQGGPADGKGRFFLVVETVGVGEDTRGEAGLQSGPDWPAVGLAITSGGPLYAPQPAWQLNARGGAAGAVLHHTPAQRRDGVELECTVEGGDGFYVVPYLADAAAAAAKHPKLGYRLTVYADVPFEIGGASGTSAAGKELYNCRKCPMFQVFQRLSRLEESVCAHIDFVSALG